MNKQVRAALSAVREFISGSSGEAQPSESKDHDLRKAVAAELLATMSIKINSDHLSDEEAQQLAEEQARSRQLFIEHGYFDQAVQDLRTGNSASERADAARALGLVGNQKASTDLLAAMFDSDAKVREAADRALSRIKEQNAGTVPPVQALQTVP